MTERTLRVAPSLFSGGYPLVSHLPLPPCPSLNWFMARTVYARSCWLQACARNRVPASRRPRCITRQTNDGRAAATWRSRGSGMNGTTYRRWRRDAGNLRWGRRGWMAPTTHAPLPSLPCDVGDAAFGRIRRAVACPTITTSSVPPSALQRGFPVRWAVHHPLRAPFLCIAFFGFHLVLVRSAERKKRRRGTPLIHTFTRSRTSTHCTFCLLPLPHYFHGSARVLLRFLIQFGSLFVWFSSFMRTRDACIAHCYAPLRARATLGRMNGRRARITHWVGGIAQHYVRGSRCGRRYRKRISRQTGRACGQNRAVEHLYPWLESSGNKQRHGSPLHAHARTAPQRTLPKICTTPRAAVLVSNCCSSTMNVCWFAWQRRLPAGAAGAGCFLAAQRAAGTYSTAVRAFASTALPPLPSRGDSVLKRHSAACGTRLCGANAVGAWRGDAAAQRSHLCPSNSIAMLLAVLVH